MRAAPEVICMFLIVAVARTLGEAPNPIIVAPMFIEIAGADAPDDPFDLWQRKYVLLHEQ